MLIVSFALLSLAAALGALLAAQLARGGRRPSWLVGAVHGGLGALGFGVLVVSLRGPPHGAASGAATFGWDAAGLLGAALAAGIVVVLRGRRPGVWVAVHAVLAVFGYVILASYVSF